MADRLHIPFTSAVLTAEFLAHTARNDYMANTFRLGFILCLKGRIEILIDSDIYDVKHNNLFVYSPSIFSDIKTISPDFYGISIFTSYEFGLPLIANCIDVKTQLFIHSNPMVTLSDKQASTIKSMFDQLNERAKAENETKLDPRRANLHNALITSLATATSYEALNCFLSNIPKINASKFRNDAIVQNFLLSLYKNFMTERSVLYYADQQSLSPSYFSSIIKTKTGNSALYWINEVVITYAKQMLRRTDNSVKELSVKLNFPSQSFFGKYFKRYTGMSPKQFREIASQNAAK